MILLCSNGLTRNNLIEV